MVLAHSPNEVQPPPYSGFGTALKGYAQLKITLGQFGSAPEQWRLRGRLEGADK